jgi:hypothetical protein
MGHSADAYLMYGYTLGDTEAEGLIEVPWNDCDYDGEFEPYLASLLGITDPSLQDPEWHPKFREYKRVLESAGVAVKSSGYEFSTKHLVASQSIVRAWDYGTVSVDLNALAYAAVNEFDPALDRFLELAGWEPPVERGWILAAHYG